MHHKVLDKDRLKLIPANKIRMVLQLVERYEEDGTLGKGIDYEKMWADMVPPMVREILSLRKLKS